MLRWCEPRSRPYLGALMLLAVLSRVAAVLVLQSHTVPRSTYEHGEIATNLLNGKGFAVKFLGAEGPTSQQAPVYPLLVTAAYLVGGAETPFALLILQLGQCLLGGLLVLVVWMLAREIAPARPSAAWLSGLVVALYPTLVYTATHVQVAALATLGLTAALALAFRTGRTGSTFDSTASGVILGLLTLTDPILALVAPAMAWAMAWNKRTITTAFVVATLVVTPWIARNAWVHGELVFVKSTFGYAFWQGNCRVSEGTDKVIKPSVQQVLESGARGTGQAASSPAAWNRRLWEARHEAGYIDDIALTQADYALLGGLSEPERSRILFRRALADLREQPQRYLSLCLRRLRYFLLFDETNPKTRSLIYRAAHLGLTGWAVLGWLLMTRSDRARLAPTLLTVGLITAFHTLTIVSARFHIPLEPILGLWGAIGMARWIEAWRAERSPSRAATPSWPSPAVPAA